MATTPKGVLESELRQLGEHFGARFSSSLLS